MYVCVFGDGEYNEWWVDDGIKHARTHLGPADGAQVHLGPLDRHDLLLSMVWIGEPVNNPCHVPPPKIPYAP
jgi:hypothetical protein